MSKPGDESAANEISLREQLEQLPGWQPYVYESLGRKDPFNPLLSAKEGEVRLSDLPDPRNLILVGVLWGEDDKFALVENPNGQSFVLREGDPVWRGRITQVEPRSITIRYNHFGMWKTINLPLNVGKEAIHALER